MSCDRDRIYVNDRGIHYYDFGGEYEFDLWDKDSNFGSASEVTKVESFPHLFYSLLNLGACIDSLLACLDCGGDAEILYQYALDYRPKWILWLMEVVNGRGDCFR